MPRDTVPPTELKVSIGQHSVAGLKPFNQDVHGAVVPEGEALRLKGVALALADGISSSPVSGAAAEMAVSRLLAEYYAGSESASVRASATQVIGAINATLHGQNASVGEIDEGRVTTLAALILKGCEAHVLHVGDSRVSRLSGQSLEPLTQDHRQELEGRHARLARALGAGAQVEVDYRRVPVSVGDTFLLSTDGVHDFIGAGDVLAALRAPDLDSAARQIVETALGKGSDDNLTVQILRVEALPTSDAALSLALADLPVPELPRAGDRLDGYRILRQIHVSARSHVFLALDGAGGKVALKIPGSDITADPAGLRRFALEEWIARRVSSPHVVTAPDPAGQRTGLYVVSDLVQGVTLRQWMTDHPRPTLDQVRGILDQITAGLRALHRREMIHQDLRPENVMIDENGTVRIIDLGSVTVTGMDEAAPGLLGMMPGTFQYTAPEYLSGDVVSWRSDQYALAVVAYEMLTGRLPYGTQVAQVRSRNDQRRLQYTPARDDESGVPDWVDAALRRALHPDPLRRYDALSEFMADLKRPGDGWRAGRHVPLAARNPLRFWQGVSAVLAVLCLILAAHLGG